MIHEFQEKKDQVIGCRKFFSGRHKSLQLWIDEICVGIHNENKLTSRSTIFGRKGLSQAWHLFFYSLIHGQAWNARLGILASVAGSSSTSTSPISCNDRHGVCCVGKRQVILWKVDTGLWSPWDWKSIRRRKRETLTGIRHFLAIRTQASILQTLPL